MVRFFRLIIAMTVVVALFAFASPALAEHEHWLQTPGTCVVNIASGQTSIDDPDHGGYHRFHVNVHTGKPGTSAFGNPNNPVSVGKGSACP